MAKKLRQWNIETYDPAVRANIPLEQFVDCCDILVLVTRWPEFKALEEMDLTGKKVFDCWGFLDESKLDCDEYRRLGRCPKKES